MRGLRSPDADQGQRRALLLLRNPSPGPVGGLREGSAGPEWRLARPPGPAAWRGVGLLRYVRGTAPEGAGAGPGAARPAAPAGTGRGGRGGAGRGGGGWGGG